MREKSEAYQAIVLDGAKAPRYLVIEKNEIKKWRFYFVVSFIFFIIAGLSLSYFSFKEKIKTFTISPGKLITNEQKLEQEIKTLEEEIQNLTLKLNNQPTTANENFLGINQGLIQLPANLKNTSSENRLRLDPFQYVKGKDFSLEFNIINNNESIKTAGFLWVVALSEGKMMVYPNNGDILSLPFKFSQGESFSVSKLRPVRAVFPDIVSKSKVIFHIYLFSRDGDLILQDKSPLYEIP